MGRVEDRIERADKREEARKPKKMAYGGLAPIPTTGTGIAPGEQKRYKKGKKVEGYKKGGKIRGAGIARKGVRACKIVKA